AYLDGLPGDPDNLAPTEEDCAPTSESESNLEPDGGEQSQAEASGQEALKGPEKFPYGAGDPEPFPLDFFPEALQEVALEIAQAVNCPLDFVGSAMIAVAATAIGRSRQIEPLEDWLVCPRLYMGLVGDPGSGKSPALAKLMRPLWKKNSQWLKDYQAKR